MAEASLQERAFERVVEKTVDVPILEDLEVIAEVAKASQQKHESALVRRL